MSIPAEIITKPLVSDDFRAKKSLLILFNSLILEAKFGDAH